MLRDEDLNIFVSALLTLRKEASRPQKLFESYESRPKGRGVMPTRTQGDRPQKFLCLNAENHAKHVLETVAS